MGSGRQMSSAGKNRGPCPQVTQKPMKRNQTWRIGGDRAGRRWPERAQPKPVRRDAGETSTFAIEPSKTVSTPGRRS
jgi:hypothetical protein